MNKTQIFLFALGVLGGAGGCERRASDVSSAAAPSVFAASSSHVRRRPARVRGIVAIAHARASHLELGHWLGGLGCAQGWGKLLYMCFYLRVRHAAHVARASPAGTWWCVWNRAFVCGVRRSGLECGVHAWNSAKRRGIRHKRWNSAKARGIPLKKWNSGVLLQGDHTRLDDAGRATHHGTRMERNVQLIGFQCLWQLRLPSHAHASRTRSLRRKRTSSLGPKLRTKEWRASWTTALLTPTSHRRYGAAPRSVGRAGGPSCGWWYGVQHQSAFKLVRTKQQNTASWPPLFLGRPFFCTDPNQKRTRAQLRSPPNENGPSHEQLSVRPQRIALSCRAIS